MTTTDPRPQRRGGMAGGVLLAFSVIAGVAVGTVYREPTIGFLAGLGVGIALILLVYLLERRR